jgi:hypothetical protein
VADITGTAVPAIFEFQHRGTCTIVVDVLKQLEKKTLPLPLRLLPDTYHNQIRLAGLKLEAGQLTIPDILFIANVSNMLQSGYINKVMEIPFESYNWFTEDHAESAFRILNRFISEEARYEVFIGHSFEKVQAGRNVVATGRVDVFDYNKIWELKWTSTLRPEHVLQVAIYGAIAKYTTLKRLDQGTYGGKTGSSKRRKSKKENMTKEEIEEEKEEMERRARVLDLTEEERQEILNRQSCSLLHVPTGQWIKIKPLLDEESDGYINLVQKLVDAKINPPPLAISDDEFLKEAKLGFPSSVGKCVVPAWLGAGKVIRSYAPASLEGL